MPDFNQWASSERALDAWKRIQHKASSITLKRGAMLLAPQLMRVESNSTASEIKGVGGGTSSAVQVILFGVRGHPEVADSDVRREDVFALNGTRYRVVHVIEPTGELQAVCEAYQ